MSSGHFYYDLLVFLFRHGAEFLTGVAIIVFAIYTFMNRKRPQEKADEPTKSSSNDELLARIAELENSAKVSKVVTQTRAAVKTKKTRAKRENTNATKQLPAAQVAKQAVAETDWSVYDTPTYSRI